MAEAGDPKFMAASTQTDPPPTSAGTKEKASFTTMPTDIKALIIDHVPRPTHLVNVCLASKELQTLAVRPLYRSLPLDLGSPADTRLAALLSPTNPGLKHIRHLRLYLSPTASGSTKPAQEQQAHFAARMLLSFLPKDILEEFSWCPWKPFSAENLLLLYARQRRMTWLEIMDLDRDVLPELRKLPKLVEGVVAPARKVAVYPENRASLGLGGYFVEKCAEGLEELIVHCNFPSRERERLGGTESAIPERELHDSATAPGVLTRSVFAHMLPFETCAPFPKLRSLRLHRVNLRHCAETWCKLVNFQEVQSLRVYHCPGADSLFGQLSKAAHLPKLLKVLEIQHKDNEENEALTALDGLLCLTTGLHTLTLDLEKVPTLPAVAGLLHHAKTLQLLNLHCAPSTSPRLDPLTLTEISDADEHVFSPEDFAKLCAACTGLEQLSCAWPATSLIRAPSADWRAFERAVGGLRGLVTLQITTWPGNKPSANLLPRGVYEMLLQALALRGFELAAGMHSSQLSSRTSPASSDDGEDEDDADDASSSTADDVPPSKLRLIAFGASDKIYEREDSKNQIIYLRSTCTDAEGVTRPYATPLGWCARQFVEPRSEVLEFVLARSDKYARAPWRESTSPWDPDEDV